MVLENIPSEDVFNDASQVRENPRTLQDKMAQFENDFSRFEYSRYSHPLPILGPLFGFTESRVRKMVASEWLWARNILGRHLRAEEEEALATAVTAQMRTMSYAGPIGSSAGLYRAYATRDTWRLPFWSMGKDFNPAAVKIPGGQTLLAGEAAKMFWRGLRGSLYAANGTIFAMCIFVSISASSVSVAIQQDPRLQDFKKAVHAQIQQSRRRARLPGPDVRGDPTGQGQKSVGELWGNHRREVDGKQPDLDDASPSNGTITTDTYYGEADQQRASGFAEESYGSSVSPKPQSTYQSSSWQPTKGSSRPAESSSADFMDDLDDASPVASPSRQQASRQPSNAWERLRREAADDMSKENDILASSRDRFGTEVERESTKSAQRDAQNDFDARLERERQGDRDSNERGRGERRW